MVDADWRPLDDRERALLYHLLSVSFTGRDELLLQLQSARVQQIDAEGSLRFSTPGPVASVSTRVPVEGSYMDGPDTQIGSAVELLVHVVDGKLHELEVHKVDGSRVALSPFEVDLAFIELWPYRPATPSTTA